LGAEARRAPVASTSGQRWRWAALASGVEVLCLTRPIWAPPEPTPLAGAAPPSPSADVAAPLAPAPTRVPALATAEALTALVAAACRGGEDPGVFPSALMLPSGGRIALCKNGNYECKCPNQATHGALCRLTRTRKVASGAAKKTNTLQGRPLGLMASWCHAAFDGSRRTHAEHMTRQPDREARRDGRHRLKHLGVPGLTLLRTERRRAADELEEPDFIV
jgi:hypothetical protein